MTTLILATLTINTIFSDAVALWRACVVWMNRPVVVCVCAALLLTGMVSGIANTVLVSTGFPPVLIYGPFYDWPGVVFLGSSLLSNIFSTAVIALKTWSHRRRLRGHLLGSRRTMAEKILIIFVESGAIFICIWTTYIALVVRFNILGGINLGSNLEPLYAFHNSLVQIITIYPTCIILLVLLERRQFVSRSTTSTSKSESDVKLPPIVTISTMVHTDLDEVIVIERQEFNVESSRGESDHTTSRGEWHMEKRAGEEDGGAKIC